MVKFSKWGSSRKAGYTTKAERREARNLARGCSKRKPTTATTKKGYGKNPKRHTYFKLYRKERDLLKHLTESYQEYDYRTLRYIYFVIIRKLFLTLQSYKDHKSIHTLSGAVRLRIWQVKHKMLPELHTAKIMNPYGSASSKHTRKSHAVFKEERKVRAFEKIAIPKSVLPKPISGPVLRPRCFRKKAPPVKAKGKRGKSEKTAPATVGPIPYPEKGEDPHPWYSYWLSLYRGKDQRKVDILGDHYKRLYTAYKRTELNPVYFGLRQSPPRYREWSPPREQGPPYMRREAQITPTKL